jgi:hypothetical protein
MRNKDDHSARLLPTSPVFKQIEKLGGLYNES